MPPEQWVWLWVVACLFDGVQGMLRAPPSISTPPPPPPSTSPSLKNFHGRTVTIVMKDTYASRLVSDSSGWQRFKYRDGYVLDTFVKTTGIIPRVVPPRGCTFKNVSCSPMEDIIRGYAELTFNSEFVDMRQSLRYVELSPPLTYGYIMVVTARGSRVATMTAAMAAVDDAVWVVMAMTLLATSAAWCSASPAPKPSLMKACMKVMALLASVPTSNPHHIKSNTLRELFIICSMFSIIFVCLFQGVLVNNMANASFEEEIATLEELANSDIEIIATRRRYAQGVAGSELELMKRIFRKITNSSDLQERYVPLLEWLSHNQKVAILIADIAFQLLSPWTEGGVESVHLVPEPLFMYSHAFPMPKGSPYAERLKAMTGHLLQAGIMQYWFESTMKNVVKDQKKIEPYFKETNTLSPKTVVDLDDLMSVFLMVLASYAVASVAFLAELIMASRITTWLQRERQLSWL